MDAKRERFVIFWQTSSKYISDSAGLSTVARIDQRYERSCQIFRMKTVVLGMDLVIRAVRFSSIETTKTFVIIKMFSYAKKVYKYIQMIFYKLYHQKKRSSRSISICIPLQYLKVWSTSKPSHAICKICSLPHTRRIAFICSPEKARHWIDGRQSPLSRLRFDYQDVLFCELEPSEHLSRLLSTTSRSIFLPTTSRILSPRNFSSANSYTKSKPHILHLVCEERKKTDNPFYNPRESTFTATAYRITADARLHYDFLVCTRVKLPVLICTAEIDGGERINVESWLLARVAGLSLSRGDKATASTA